VQGKPSAVPPRLYRGRPHGRSMRTYWQLYLMLLIPMLFLFVFKYGSYFGLAAAFENYKILKGVLGSKWVGFANFVKVFNHRRFGDAIRNTLLLNVLDLAFGFPMPIILALMLNEIRHRLVKRTTQTLLYLPHFLSWVIVVGIAQTIFASDGAVNQLLMTLGLTRDPVFFLGEGKYFWWLVGVINLWKECGWNTIIYLAAMAAIDPALYEAADMDGAGRFRKMFHITLPGIKSTFVVLLVMNIGYLMEAGFEIQYLMGQNVVMDWSQTIDIFALKYGITKGQYSRAIAAGIFKSLVSIALMLSANFTARKLGEDTLL